MRGGGEGRGREAEEEEEEAEKEEAEEEAEKEEEERNCIYAPRVAARRLQRQLRHNLIKAENDLLGSHQLARVDGGAAARRRVVLQATASGDAHRVVLGLTFRWKKGGNPQ